MSEAARKAEQAARGLCRQCGARRGKCPSKSRCARCLERNRALERRRKHNDAHTPGGPGRPPLF